MAANRPEFEGIARGQDCGNSLQKSSTDIQAECVTVVVFILGKA